MIKALTWVNGPDQSLFHVHYGLWCARGVLGRRSQREFDLQQLFAPLVLVAAKPLVLVAFPPGVEMRQA